MVLLYQSFGRQSWDDEEKIMYCIAKDGTEKKRMEAAVVNEQQRLQELFTFMHRQA